MKVLVFNSYGSAGSGGRVGQVGPSLSQMWPMPPYPIVTKMLHQMFPMWSPYFIEAIVIAWSNAGKNVHDLKTQAEIIEILQKLRSCHWDQLKAVLTTREIVYQFLYGLAMNPAIDPCVYLAAMVPMPFGRLAPTAPNAPTPGPMTMLRGFGLGAIDATAVKIGWKQGGKAQADACEATKAALRQLGFTAPAGQEQVPGKDKDGNPITLSVCWGNMSIAAWKAWGASAGRAVGNFPTDEDIDVLAAAVATKEGKGEPPVGQQCPPGSNWSPTEQACIGAGGKKVSTVSAGMLPGWAWIALLAAGGVAVVGTIAGWWGTGTERARTTPRGAPRTAEEEERHRRRRLAA